MAEEDNHVEDNEMDTDVEVIAAPETSSDVSLQSDNVDSDDDQFRKAETATQKRIDRLTKKMREAERREQEALSYARQVQTEAEGIKKRMSNLDNSYVSEFSTRVGAQMEQAESELSRAMELGDTKSAVESQRKITSLAIQADRAEQAKAQQAQQVEQAQYVQQHQQAQQSQQAQRPAPARRPDPKAEEWATKNKWFGEDQTMTYAVFGVHKKLIEDEKFDPQSDEYYTELDRRMAEEFPHKFKGQSRRPAQTVASASRTTSTGRSGRKVRLTPSQVAIAKKLGVPLEEYAKYVKE
tara:strand:+ start:1304 stop:2191 length:888 start_codon:yes stop_codon:yes gene_type:complete